MYTHIMVIIVYIICMTIQIDSYGYKQQSQHRLQTPWLLIPDRHVTSSPHIHTQKTSSTSNYYNNSPECLDSVMQT